ncbi:MAG TPA: PTS sugar transporter subunit IIA [Gemmatimonadales bacterium]|nr:PTS sugar transporter subunit IIA [Gemmatimonadales bacterium]
MQLTIREAASYFGVNEQTIRRWISQRGMPVHEVYERIYLNPLELWEWAIENGISVSRGLLEKARRSPEEVPPLAELLRTGGIFHDVEGETKGDVLRALVQRLPLPPELDRDFLLSVFEAREAMGSTGIGDGIAIPHVRNPVVLHVDQPFVTLCLLRHPVDFDAPDGQPVHALFLVVSLTVPAHLRMLAQLGFVLRDEPLRQLLRAAAPIEAILGRVGFVEGSLRSGSYPAGKRSS